MIQSLRRITLIASLLLVVTSQPTYAFFGSECKKPKASYENFQNQAQKFMLQANKSQSANKEKLKKDMAFCKSDFKSFIATRDKFEKQLIKSKKNCGLMSIFDEYLFTPGYSESIQATKDSYQVVLNNQKCFSPELVIEAQRKLGLIK